MIDANQIKEHRPEVPERPDMSCVVRLGPIGELINQMRGASLADKIAAIDAEIAALGEGSDAS